MTKADHIARARKLKAQRWAQWLVSVLSPATRTDWREAARTALQLTPETYVRCAAEVGAHPPSDETRRVIAAEIGDLGMRALHGG